MTVLWIVLGSIAALVAAVVVIGLFMPERYEGAASIVYDATPTRVWEALQDYRRHPMTGKMMKRVEDVESDPGLPTWIEDMGHGELVTVTTDEADAPKRLVREMQSKSVPMTSRWEYVLTPEEAGCRLDMSGVTHIRSGTWHVPIFRVMMAIGGGVRRGLQIQMKMVAATLAIESTA